MHFLMTILLAAMAGAAAWGAPTAAPRQANLLVISDWGFSKPEVRTTNQPQAAQGLAQYAQQSRIAFDAVLVGGDNFKVKLAGPGDPQFGEAFEAMYDPQRLPMPFHAILGSHDYEYGGAEAQLAYSARHPESRWKMPGRWYRLELPAQEPLVTVLMLDSDRAELSRAQWKEEQQWMARELAKPRTAPWLICMGHHPLYSDGRHGDNAAMQAAWGPLLKKHSVDFYVSGHDHVLEHLQMPGWRTTFLISGGGGENINRPYKTGRAQFVKPTLGFLALEFTEAAAKVSLVDDAGTVLHAFERDRAGKEKILQTTAVAPYKPAN